MKTVILAAAFSLLCGGCSTIALIFLRGDSVQDCGGAIPSTETVDGDIDKRLRVEVQGAQVTEGFEVIVQKRGDRLVVLGLTRFGSRAFTILQEGERIEIDSPMEAIERVSPVNILRDLYIWPLMALPPGSAELTLSDDGKSATVDHQDCGFSTILVELESGGD